MSARRPAPVYRIHWVNPPTPEQRSAMVDDCLPLFAEALRVARRMEEGSRVVGDRAVADVGSRADGLDLAAGTAREAVA